MRHRRRGRKLGRNPNHQRALLRNLARALILTERDPDENDPNKPKVKGRIITTLQKAKEVRPLVERCVTIARRALVHQQAADELNTTAARNTEGWRAWRAQSPVAAVDAGRGPRGGGPTPSPPPAGGQAGGADPVRRPRHPLRRSAGRIHPGAPPGHAPAGRRRAPGPAGVRGHSGPRAQEGPQADDRT